MSLANKVALITGGSSGIGASTAIVFAKELATVAIVGRDKARLEAVSGQCEAVGKKALCIQADITKDEETKEIIKKVIGAHGKLDILVNNAGISPHGKILNGNLLEVYDNVMDVNLRAVVHLTTLAARHLIETKGNIINISSITASSLLRRPGLMAYGMSKAGLDHFTRGAALELLNLGVRVNTVTPGLTRTSILAKYGLKTWEEVRISAGLKRICEPEEVADLIAYLASDRAIGITGSNYVIDNGSLVKS